MKPTFIALCLCLGGCGKKDPVEPAASNTEATKPEPTKAVPKKLDLSLRIVEKAIRSEYAMPTGELSKTDLARVLTLSLSGTQITDAGLKEVAKMPKLKTLFLHDCKITDAGLQELAKMKNLEYVLCMSTQVTRVGVTRIESISSIRVWGP